MKKDNKEYFSLAGTSSDKILLEDRTEGTTEIKKIVQTREEMSLIKPEMKTKISEEEEEFVKGKPYRYIRKARLVND